MEQEMITITKEEYEELKSDQNLLECLQNCGVDNWEGYCDAQEMYQDEYG